MWLPPATLRLQRWLWITSCMGLSPATFNLLAAKVAMDNLMHETIPSHLQPNSWTPCMGLSPATFNLPATKVVMDNLMHGTIPSHPHRKSL